VAVCEIALLPSGRAIGPTLLLGQSVLAPACIAQASIAANSLVGFMMPSLQVCGFRRLGFGCFEHIVGNARLLLSASHAAPKLIDRPLTLSALMSPTYRFSGCLIEPRIATPSVHDMCITRFARSNTTGRSADLSLFFNGADAQDRTADLLITNQLLYR
jgi:hypothetical protein